MFQGVHVRYLLDTNALLYVFSAPSELSARARRIVRGEIDLSVSVVSFWEIAIKQSIGKLQFGMTIPRPILYHSILHIPCEQKDTLLRNCVLSTVTQRWKR